TAMLDQGGAFVFGAEQFDMSEVRRLEEDRQVEQTKSTKLLDEGAQQSLLETEATLTGHPGEAPTVSASSAEAPTRMRESRNERRPPARPYAAPYSQVEVPYSDPARSVPAPATPVRIVKAPPRVAMIGLIGAVLVVGMAVGLLILRSIAQQPS